VNIAVLLARSAHDRAATIAWRYGSRDATYAELGARAGALAADLRAAGLEPGERVVLCLPNRPELVEMLWAIWWAGMVAVPVNWHLHSEEVQYVIENSGARAILVDEHTADLVPESARAELIILQAGTLRADGAAVAPPAPADVDADGSAWLFYTSGTTGRPKGAMLTHRNLWAMMLNYYADVDPVAAGSVFAHVAPLTHGSGLYLLPAVGRAATNVIAASHHFDASEFAALVASEGVTHIAFLAPTMLRRLAENELLRGYDLSALRSIVVGGAPLYRADFEHARSVLGPIISQIYGQGEAPMTITVMSAGPRAPHSVDALAASCGRAFSGVEVRIVDSDDKWVTTGTVGEVCVRGDVVMRGYWNNAPATATALRGGWLRTGDIGYLDGQGYLFLTDRAKDVIITGGSNVYPREVEEVLLTYPGVQEVAVIGVPDPEWGESIRAYVVAEVTDALRADLLIDYVRQHLASFKKPKSVVFVDGLPKNSTGKVLKRQLAGDVTRTVHGS
jgi:long-chain acyl-CoA synthetase